ncbi:MAG: hypothetical protein AB4911_02005 [Oscillochloridaceae bacterium umkhey_bin13]
MNLNQQQARMAGLALIVLGVMVIFNLWWMLPAALMATGGVVIYRRQRALGRTGEAVQGALWGLGLALLLVLDFVFPGVLLLGGASLLLRGREAAAEARVFGVIGSLSRRRNVRPTPVMAAPQQNINAPDQRVTVVERREG